MDRHDESRSVNEDDRDEAASSARSTDILGLGGSPVPKMPGDPSASNDPESVRRRRERAMESEEPMTHEDGDRQRSGATGIDMGSGGQGTHISGE
jgi:hypothetical protein